MTKDDELKAIADALDVLLASIISDRALYPRDVNRSWPADEGGARFVPESPAQAVVFNVMENPREGAFTMAIRALGDRLHELGGLAAMGAALDEMAERRPEQAEQRESILDARWSGIGSWMS